MSHDHRNICPFPWVGVIGRSIQRGGAVGDLSDRFVCCAVAWSFPHTLPPQEWYGLSALWHAQIRGRGLSPNGMLQLRNPTATFKVSYLFLFECWLCDWVKRGHNKHMTRQRGTFITGTRFFPSTSTASGQEIPLIVGSVSCFLFDSWYALFCSLQQNMQRLDANYSCYFSSDGPLCFFCGVAGCRYLYHYAKAYSRHFMTQVFYASGGAFGNSEFCQQDRKDGELVGWRGPRLGRRWAWLGPVGACPGRSLAWPGLAR